MSKVSNDQFLYFATFPDVQSIIDEVVQIWNSRLNNTMVLETMLKHKYWCIDSYVEYLPPGMKNFVKRKERDFTEWINDQVMLRIKKNNSITAIAVSPDNESTKIGLNNNEEEVPIKDITTMAMSVAPTNATGRALSRFANRDETKDVTENNYTMEVKKLTLRMELTCNWRNTVLDTFNRNFKCKFGVGKLMFKDKIETNIFYCSCDDKEDVVFQFRNNPNDDIICNEVKKLMVLRAFATVKNHKIIEDHFVGAKNILQEEGVKFDVRANRKSRYGPEKLSNMIDSHNDTIFVGNRRKRPCANYRENELSDEEDNKSRKKIHRSVSNIAFRNDKNVNRKIVTSQNQKISNGHYAVIESAEEKLECIECKKDENGVERKWQKDIKGRLRTFENRRLHAEWYKSNIMLPEERIWTEIGYCPVQYPEILKTYGERKRVDREKEYNDICTCCKYKLEGGDRYVFVDGSSNGEKECEHKYCEVCAYGWFIGMPTPNVYMKTYILSSIKKACGKCATYGVLRKGIFGKKEIDRSTVSDPSWVEGELFPQSNDAWGLHQVPKFSICNLITKRTLFHGISKMEKANGNNAPLQVENLIGGIDLSESQAYILYQTAVYNKFQCSNCKESKPCYEQFVGENCEKGCEYHLCMDCCAANVVEKYGSRRGTSNNKYLKGWMKCTSCTGKEGRLINKLTSQYLTI
jgi:hypothetical protein